MTITPEQAEIIERAVESDRIDLHVGLPGRIQAVYPAVAGTRDWGVDVVLEVKRTLPSGDKTYTTEELPVLRNVPVAFQGSNNFFLAFALSAGDQGRVMFCEQSIDQWRTKGDTTSPGDIGRHTLTGGVFVPDLKSIVNAFTDVLTVGAAFGKKGGTQLRATGTTLEATTAGAVASIGGFVALATLVDSLWTVLTTTLDAFIPPGTPDGGAALAAAMSAAIKGTPAYQNTASKNLKAD